MQPLSAERGNSSCCCLASFCSAPGEVGLPRRSFCKKGFGCSNVASGCISFAGAKRSLTDPRHPGLGGEREEEVRAARAISLVHMVELSGARQALEGALVAPGTHATLRALTDPERRPALPCEPLNPEVAHTQLAVAFQLDTDLFLVNLRKSRRGAAPGPSGMHSDHLFPLLDRISWHKWRAPWLWVMSMRMFWRSSGLVGSQHYGSQTGVSGDRGWRHLEKVGGQDNREASVEEGRSSHRSLPTSIVH